MLNVSWLLSNVHNSQRTLDNVSGCTAFALLLGSKQIEECGSLRGHKKSYHFGQGVPFQLL